MVNDLSINNVLVVMVTVVYGSSCVQRPSDSNKWSNQNEHTMVRF